MVSGTLCFKSSSYTSGGSVAGRKLATESCSQRTFLIARPVVSGLR